MRRPPRADRRLTVSHLFAIGTAVPPHAYPREFARDRMSSWMPDRATRRLLRGVHDHTGIDVRYSVLPDFLPGAEPLLFRAGPDGAIPEPSTGARNRVFAQQAPALALAAARDSLSRARGVQAQQITHLVTASCTGFSNPGWDLDLVRGLGLNPSVERYHLGFMGCYAAFPALRLAHQICSARPGSTVLVVCLELCTLHLQIRPDPDNLLANALFADGAAAALVTATAPRALAFRLHGFSSALAPEGAGDMAWDIGDHGFDIRLSSYVPDIIGTNLQGVIDAAFAGSDFSRETIGLWAIHPGGRAILDKIERELALPADALADSRSVLREYGNMSSATILFVLQRMLARTSPTVSRQVCAMAFGPGLTIESALLERVPDPAPGALEGHHHEARAAR